MKLRFEYGALMTVACLVSGLIAVVILNPLDRNAASPRASMHLAVSLPVPAPVSPVFSSPLLDGTMIGIEVVGGTPISSLSYGNHKTAVRTVGRMAGIDTLTGVFSINAIERYHRLLRMKSSGALSSTFKQLGYDLDRVGVGKAAVPRFFLASLPRDIRKIRESSIRKSLFFKTVLPLVLQANEEILRDRRRLWNIHFQASLGKTPVAEDRLWLGVISERYGLKEASIEVLLKRVDIIPPSLALAQAAEESGWGTSRFVREGNAIFGQWTFSEAGGLIPAEREADKQHRVRAFGSLLDSVRAYARNLNTHAAYQKMRRLRHSLRLKGAPVEGMLLVDHLKNYSQRGEKYVQAIRGLIVGNNLHLLDDARLHNGTPKPRPLI